MTFKYSFNYLILLALFSASALTAAQESESNKRKHEESFESELERYGIQWHSPEGSKKQKLQISAARHIATSHFDIGIAQDQHIRDHMEDRTLSDVEAGDSNGLFCVFDGHGGSKSVDHVYENFQKTFEHAENCLPLTFQKLDFSLMNHAETHRSGTTAVVAYVKGATATIANTGDSRIVFLRGNQVIDSTVDHKPDSEKESSRIKDAGGFVHTADGDDPRVGGLSCSRALGDWQIRNHPIGVGIIAAPDIKEWALQKNDMLVLASDGIWDVMKNDEVAQGVDSFLIKHGSIDAPALEKTAQWLLAQAIEKGSQDNLTAMLVRIKKIDKEEPSSQESLPKTQPL